MPQLSFPCSVGELTAYLRGLLESDALLSEVWVEGEISNLRTPSSGHVYFTLKDARAALRCVLFRSRKEALRFAPEEGLAVVVRGAVGIYEAMGQYQLYVEELVPVGQGALFLAFQQMKERLEREGLFDPAVKRPLPAFPRRIGLVTSRTGAVLRDILTVGRRRFPGMNFLLIPVPVQGEQAPAAIRQALERAGREELDLVILARGGGSLEELWAFNDEGVARAIRACPVPVVSAVGHETDFTIADFAADRRAPTPSAAAEICVPDRRELERRIGQARGRLAAALRRAADRGRLRWMRQTEALRRFPRRLEERSHALDALELRLRAAGGAAAHRGRSRVEALAGRLAALSPLGVLSRGYAVCRVWPEGPVVSSVEQTAPGERLAVRLKDGRLCCAVEEVGRE